VKALHFSHAGSISIIFSSGEKWGAGTLCMSGFKNERPKPLSYFVLVMHPEASGRLPFSPLVPKGTCPNESIHAGVRAGLLLPFAEAKERRGTPLVPSIRERKRKAQERTVSRQRK
jgi:hypothetical protein